jgi:hypothetical protein
VLPVLPKSRRERKYPHKYKSDFHNLERKKKFNKKNRPELEEAK